MARGRHSGKEIEASLQYADNQNWNIVESARGHCWESFAARMAVVVVRNRFGRHHETQKTMPVRFDALLIDVHIKVEE